MTKRKTLLYFVARATMTLFLAVAGITNASAAAHWVGNSAIYVNGTWYYAGTEFDWCTGGAFDGANLGTFVNSIPLAGQSQNHEYGDVNWNGGSVTMYYKIDGGEQQSISLPWQSYNSDTHNNLFESKDGWGDFVITKVDISGLSVGSHTIEVYYYCDNAWDSNNSQNYKANFTVCDETEIVNYIDENGKTQSVTANVLANDIDVSNLQANWYVVEGIVNYSSTLYFTDNANLILADGARLTINSSDCGIYSGNNFSIYSQSTGNNQGVINATGGYSMSIYVKDISIYGGVVHVYDSDYGIFTTGNISIYDGNIDASGDSYGIDANYGNGTITIYGGSVKADSYGGTVKIASGLVYSDGTINNIKGTISDVSDIANKTLSLYGYSYIDDEGNGQIKTTSEVMVINSGNQPSSLGDYNNMDNDYWYVITGNDVVFDDEVDGYGNIHLILTDDANITFNTAIQVSGSLTIYGQGDDTGTLNSASYGYGISVFGDFTINGGTINASSPNNSGISASSVTINGGTVTATGDDYGISTGGEIIINGGFIEAIGDDYGIYSSDGSITITGGTVTTTGGISTDSSSDITITGGKVTANGKEDGISSSGGNIIISGGDITAISTGNNEDRGGIWTFGGDIKITDGNVTATATGTNGNGLFSGQNDFYGDEFGGSITISGGTVIANGNKSGIYAKAVEGNVCTITLSGGSVTAKASDENLANSYRGNVIIADDLIYSDGTNTYEGLLTLDNNQKAAIAGKGMHPVRKSYTLTAKKVNDDDDYYWTTFYCGDAGYSIEDSEAIEGDDAYAYTATYNSDNNNIVLHSLGTNIPEKTAVVIVSSSSSVSLSKADNLGKFSGSNDLRGVDVATAFDDLKTAYSADALLMLSNKNGNFGFHDVALTNVPARKAFLPIDDPDPNPVRSFNIVFEDDDTTGINAVNNEERICNDTWYDLQGRKIQMPTQRGLYIHNGKKIVVK